MVGPIAGKVGRMLEEPGACELAFEALCPFLIAYTAPGKPGVCVCTPYT